MTDQTSAEYWEARARKAEELVAALRAVNEENTNLYVENATLRAENSNLSRRLDALANEKGKRTAALRMWVPLAEAAAREEVTDCADWDAALDATRALL